MCNRKNSWPTTGVFSLYKKASLSPERNKKDATKDHRSYEYER